MSGTWATGWASGDIVTAAEFAKGTGCIYDTTLGVGAANIDVTGIVGSYAHLLVILYVRSDTAAFLTDIMVRFNGDTGANYTGNSTSTNTAITMTGTNMPAASSTAGLFAGCGVLIPNYAAVVGDKPAVMFGMKSDSSTSNLLTTGLGAGIWRNTSAITRVTVLPTAGSLVIGSRMSIYAFGS